MKIHLYNYISIIKLLIDITFINPFNEGFLFVREFIVFNFDRMKLFQRYSAELSELRKL